MSPDEPQDEYRWRETYFVFFAPDRRPSAERVRQALQELNRRYQCTNLIADAEGRFESLTVHAPDDFSAMEISYEAGPDVREQGQTLARELKACAGRDAELLAQIKHLAGCEARLDVMHLERVSADAEEEADEMFDPSALIVVLEALAELTGGVSIDPQSGALL